MTKKSNTKEFVEKGKRLFGRRYDYSESVYVNSGTPIKIKCRKHGPLKNLTPQEHLRRGGGCRECKAEQAQRRYVMPLDKFINRATELHGDAFDYSLAHQFKNHQEKINIKCNDCGNIFQQNPNKHLAGQGCSNKICVSKKISEKRTKVSLEEFIARANKLHGKGRYSYENVKLIDIKTKVEIICNLCNTHFFQEPDSHWRRSGCPKCGEEIRILGDTLYSLLKSKRFIPGNLYIIQCFNEKESFFKIGISSRPVRLRFSGTKLPYDFEVMAELPIGIIEAFQQEQYFKETYSRYSYRPDNYFGGHTECFSVNPLEIDDRLKEIYMSYSPSIENV